MRGEYKIPVGRGGGGGGIGGVGVVEGAPTLLTPLPLLKGILDPPQFPSHQETKMAARRTQRSTWSTSSISRKNGGLWTVYTKTEYILLVTRRPELSAIFELCRLRRQQFRAAICRLTYMFYGACWHRVARPELHLICSLYLTMLGMSRVTHSEPRLPTVKQISAVDWWLITLHLTKFQAYGDW